MDEQHVDTQCGRVSLHGATVTRWERGGRNALFVSEHARYTAGVPIRGGVPLVFPWFGADPEGRGRPAHGFARILPWDLVEHDRASVVLELHDSAATRALWPFRFRLQLRVEFGDELQMEMSVENRGDVAFGFENAMHTYFAVSDVRECAVWGLHKERYLDKTQGQKLCVQDDESIRFVAETDRTYLGTEGPCRIVDSGGGRTIEVFKSGSRSTVVWNPWIDWAARTTDFGATEWRRMVCVESGNVGEDAVTLDPQAVHQMSVRIRCSDGGQSAAE